MANICAGSDKVEWKHWRQLAQEIDDLAAYLGTPDYEKLTTDPTLPFIEPTLPQVTGVLELEVTASAAKNECPVVSKKAILQDFNDAAVCFRSGNMTGAQYRDFYSEYIDAGRLFFVQEETPCLCKTIYKVVEEAACEYGLELITGNDPQDGCCQTDLIPVVGEELGYDQRFIPAAYACQWADTNGVNNSEIERLIDLNGNNSLYCPACTAVSGTGAGGCAHVTYNRNYVQFKFNIVPDPAAPTESIYVLKSAARALKGYLTWPILKEHMEKLFEKIKYILQCTNNDGLRPKDLSQSPSTINAEQGYLQSNPTLWRKDDIYEEHGGYETVDGWRMWGWGCGAWDIKAWLASLNFEFTTLGKGSHNPEASGNIVEPSGGDAGSVSNCGASMLTPWLNLTGNAEYCGSTGEPKVYCETLNQISDLIHEMRHRLWPKGAFSDITPDLCNDGDDDDDDVVQCCEENYCGAKLRRECGEAGGRAVDNCGQDCCPSETAAQDCAMRNNPACPDEALQNCIWKAEECFCDCPEDGFECENKNEYQYYCCCNSYCGGPFEADDYNPPSCDGECRPVQSCDTTNTDTYCYNPEGGSCSCRSYSCEAPCSPCSFGDLGCQLTSCTNVNCTDFPTPPEPEYYVNLTPQFADCGDCDRPCCLSHAAFEENEHGCLEYLSEINEFVAKATDSMFTSCDYASREISPGSPSCDKVTCGSHCRDYLSGPIETCMNQAAFVWELVETGNQTSWYTLEISAPGAP